MLKLRSPSQQEQILALAMRQIEKLLKEMQTSGKDLSRLKLKKFQKTHHIDCKCKLCENAKTKNDLRLRGPPTPLYSSSGSSCISIKPVYKISSAT